MRPDEIHQGHTYRCTDDLTRRVDTEDDDRIRVTLRRGDRVLSSGVRLTRQDLAAMAVADVTDQVAPRPTAPEPPALPRHTCHARGCETPVPKKMLMCGPHWGQVPERLRRAVWKHYQDGQEEGQHTPTPAWHEAADAAIGAVADLEAAKPKPQPTLFDSMETAS